MGVPNVLQEEIEELRGQFGPVDIDAGSEECVLLELRVRGVTLRAVVEQSYPDRPPLLFAEGGWHHPNLTKDGRVSGLTCFADWNRTFGLALVVRELNQRFLEHPPAR